MNPKALAQSILEMLLNGLHQLHATKREGGHDDCYSLAEVEAFCRERANNIAQALPELIASETKAPAETPPAWFIDEVQRIEQARVQFDQSVGRLLKEICESPLVAPVQQ